MPPLTTLWVSQGIYHPILADKLLECLLKGVGSRQGTLNDWSSLSITRASLMFPKEKFFAWAKTSLWERTNSWHYFELFLEKLTAKPFFAKENDYFQPAFLQGVEFEENVEPQKWCKRILLLEMRSGLETGKSFLLNNLPNFAIN